MQVTANDNGDVYIGLGRYAEGSAFTVYIKDVSYEVIAQYTIHFETNGGEAITDAILAEGTSLVGFDTTYATSKANAFFEGWYLTSTFEEGTRVGTDITSLPNTEFTVYAKWDEYSYKAQYYSNLGSWFGGQAAKVLVNGAKAGDTVTLTMKVKTSHDGNSGEDIILYQAYGTSEWIGNVADGYSNGVNLNVATESGWREITIKVTLEQDGYVWITLANKVPATGQCWLYMKDVSVFYKAQYYSSVNSWFGGQATKVLLNGYNTGDVVTLTMKVQTSQDGMEGASIRLYQTYADTEWIGSNNSDGYSNGAILNPATESGWREVTLTVTLKQDGYVWLSVANTNPSLGQCWVYITDVVVNA